MKQHIAALIFASPQAVALPDIRSVLEEALPTEVPETDIQAAIGAIAEQFKVGVEALIESSPTSEEIDAYLERYAARAQQPVVMH